MVTKPDHFLCLLKELLESRTVCPEREKPHDIAVHSNRDLQVLQYLCVNSRIPVLSNFHSSFVHSRGHPFIPFHYSLKTAESAVQKLLQLQAVRVAFLPQWPLHWSEVMETGLLTLERLDRQQLESQFPARVLHKWKICFTGALKLDAPAGMPLQFPHQCDSCQILFGKQAEAQLVPGEAEVKQPCGKNISRKRCLGSCLICYPAHCGHCVWEHLKQKHQTQDAMAESLFVGLTALPMGRNLKNPAIHILVYNSS